MIIIIKTFNNHRPMIKFSLSWEERNPDFYIYKYSNEILKLKHEAERIKRLIK